TLLDGNTKRVDLTPSIGTELAGVQIKDLNDIQLNEVARLVAERGVVFFRDQQLSRDQQLDFGRKFGPLHIHPVAPGPEGYPEIICPSGGSKNLPMELNKTRADTWHTDVSFDVISPSFSILQLLRIPPVGGDTIWANSYHLYDELSPAFQTFLDSLTGIHSGEGFLQLSKLVGLKPVYEIPVATEHPVVRTNPVTKQKALYVNPGFTKSIKNLTPHESDTLLNYLFTHIKTTTKAQVRWTWTANTVAIWDNRSTLHVAVNDYEYAEAGSRYGERVTVVGLERPYFDPENSTTEKEVKAKK
ncbi:taurine catabolism dioxygenase, partial [Basidiobolus meristosporus CBS 931.73]